GGSPPAGGDRPRRARRPGRRRARPRARARCRRTRPHAPHVPDPPRAGTARAPRPAAHRARRPDRGHPEPARRDEPAGGGRLRRTTRPAAKTARTAQPGRDPRPALPTHQPDRAGDRRTALPVGEHRPDAHAPPLRQARRPPPPRGRRPGPHPRPARTLREFRVNGVIGHDRLVSGAGTRRPSKVIAKALRVGFHLVTHRVLPRPTKPVPPPQPGEAAPTSCWWTWAQTTPASALAGPSGES